MNIDVLKNIVEQAVECLLKPNEVTRYVLEEIISRYNNIAAEIKDDNKLPKVETFNPNVDFDYDHRLSENGVEKLTSIKIWTQGYLNCKQFHSSIKGYLQSISQCAQELYNEKDNVNVGALKALIKAYNKIVANVKDLNKIDAFDREKDAERNNPRISGAGLKKLAIIKNNLINYINKHPF